MEKFALSLQSKTVAQAYVTENRLMRYEQEIMAEIISAIENGDTAQLTWFSGFGDSFRQILKLQDRGRSDTESLEKLTEVLPQKSLAVQGSRISN